MAEALKEKKEEKLNLYEATLRQIKELTRGAQIKERQNTTGSSFFEGSKRFCKLVKTDKGGAFLEINVLLPKEMQDLPGMTTFSKVEASRKHLGTMRHAFRTSDEKDIAQVLKEAWRIFREEVAKEEEAKDSSKADSKEDKHQKDRKGNSVSSEKVETRKLSEEDIKRLQKYQREGKYKERPPVEKKVEVAKSVKETDSAAGDDETTGKVLEVKA